MPLSLQLEFAHFVTLWRVSPDPEEALGGDEVECLIERHDEGSEVARHGPASATPPQDLDVIVLTGRSQARDLTAGASAVERVAPVGPDHRDAAAWPGGGGDPLAHRIGAGHRGDLL